MQFNRFALADFMAGEGLRLVDLAERIREQDPDGKGLSLSFLSELRSGAKTVASPATIKKIADALGVHVRSLALPAADAEAAA